MDSILASIGFVISLIITFHLMRGTRIASYLFMFSAVHVVYVFPKLMSLALSDHPMAEAFQTSGTTTLASFMALSSYLCAAVTYRWLAPPITLQRCPDISRHAQRVLVQYAILIGLLATFALLILTTITGGPIAYYLGAGFYQMGFEGINVWLLFVSRFIYVAIAAAMMATLTRPTRFRICLLAALCIGPLLSITFLFRRTDLLILGFIAIYGWVIILGLRPKRLTVLLACLVAALAIISFPYLRQASVSAATGWDYGTSDATLTDRITDTFSIESSDEVLRAASIIEHTHRSGNLQLGSFVWNSLVRQFIPSSLFGPTAKKELIITLGPPVQKATSDFDTQSYFYVAPMGFSQAYEQFDIFGGLIFAAFAGLIAFCERRSHLLSNRIFVMLAIPFLCLAATNDIGSVPASLFTFWMLTRPLGRLKTNDRLTHQRISHHAHA